MRYCKVCVLPNTRPGLTIDREGVCSACRGHEYKKTIDWAGRRRECEAILSRARSRKSGYDCIVPVSGGKDSTWQVVKCLEYGLRILGVTWRTPARTELGQKNLDNLIRLGIDHIDYSIDPEIEKRFMHKTLVKTGSTAVPMHMALFSIPLKIAVSLNIPLVVWGESPHMEYGGSKKDRDYNRLDLGWFKRHGILQGTSASDWIDKDLTRKDLEPYFLPDREEFTKRRIESIFLGFYLPWDPQESFRVARDNGFRNRAEGPRTGYYDYADIDCDFISVHHYFKWLKFGFTRLFDNLSIEIRSGRMTRGKAVSIIAKTGTQVPHEDINKLCKFLDMPLGEFHEIEERFRNHKIWSRKNGRWMIENFIIEGRDWR
jgi:N-acetyl sugar amidotransferase